MLRWGAAAALVLGAPSAAAGCTRGQGSPSPVDQQRERDDAARARAIARSQALLTATQQLHGTVAAVTALLTAAPAIHRAHLQALAGGTVASAPPSMTSPSAAAAAGSASGSASGSGVSAATPAPATAATLVALTSATVAANLTEVAAVSPTLAQLLAQVAAAQAELADRFALAAALPLPATTPGTLVTPPETPDGVEPSGSATPGPTSGGATSRGATSGGASPTGPVGRTQALVTLVGAEQGLDYVYGVLASRADAGTAARIATAWTAHRRRLAVLSAQLRAVGSAVPAAPAGYDLGEPPAGEAAVLDLAATAENGCTGVVLALVARTEGALRTQLASEAVAQARRARAWQPRPRPFPGSAA